jgi:prophage tail gpP-like protein
MTTITTAGTDDDYSVTLVLNDKEISGWTKLRISRGIERLPNDFELSLTELYPNEALAVVVKPGDACSVKIGQQTVITGYVDKYVPSFGANGHAIRVSGRGKCQDLVDCSAEWQTSQMTSATPLVIASNLAGAYDILVECFPTDVPAVPQFNIILGETPYEIIDRVCKYTGLLAYEGTNGHLILNRVGTTAHSSGLYEGQNVEEASVEYSMDQRYQTYEGWLNAVSLLGNAFDSSNASGVQTDSSVTRNRKKFVMAEAANGYPDLLQRRLAWEMNRRAGRAAVARVKVDSWFDSARLLWTPNQLASIYLPTLKLADTNGQALNWLIGEVSYVMDESGTHADLVLMDPKAFQVEPAALPMYLYDPHLAQ